MTNPLITIAIRDIVGTGARERTLTALARATPEPHEIVLIATEPPPGPWRALAVPDPLRAPDALNRLLAAGTAPLVLLLESGAIVTPGWLKRLLEALDDPAVGLCGPSTNTAWNEQQVFPQYDRTDWSSSRIDAFAAEIAARYGDTRRPLDTLHSLADFCYAFKRAVAEALGGFDPAYGAGPCWEIDFTTRAARAGYSAVWVMGAYVHRASAWRAQSDRRLFEANKHLYQDRFCGLRLRGLKQDYEPHCRGEACEHFAPAGLIQATLQERPRNQPPPRVAQLPIPARRPEPALIRPPIAATAQPLVSCIMPTRNRRAFVAQALHYLQRQDYPNLELIIVDDGADAIADLVPELLAASQVDTSHGKVTVMHTADGSTRYVRLAQHAAIGLKRNLACDLARGTIIAHWDDDDWYAPHRLRHQLARLLDGTADITGLATWCFFDVAKWEAWTCAPELHRRLFVHDVHGGTLVFHRWVWERLTRYPAISLAEDALFLREACRHGARLARLDHERSFIYLRHGTNAWNIPLGTYMDQAGWSRSDADQFFPAEDRPFYLRLNGRRALADEHAPEERARQAAHTLRPLPSTTRSAAPRVSCIMPTFNRRAFVAQAIRYFLRQDYGDCELIILDDGTDRVADLVPLDERIRYVPLEQRMVLGAKRNLACELARGAIIAHWDDDDWMAPQRLSVQVKTLEQTNADLCGAARQVYYDPSRNQAWLYEYPPAQRCWLAGNTLVYHKRFWASHSFPAIPIGEDTHFIWNAAARNAAVCPDHTFYVGLVHASNTSPKTVGGAYWKPYPVAEVHRLIGDDLAFYRTERSAP
jgi:glycosyltransferase involved in cell wall biosynthesis